MRVGTTFVLRYGYGGWRGVWVGMGSKLPYVRVRTWVEGSLPYRTLNALTVPNCRCGPCSHQTRTTSSLRSRSFCFSNFALTISYDNRLHTPPPRFVCLGTPLAMCVLPSVGVLLTAELRPQFVEQQRRDVRAAGGGGERQGSGRAARKGRGRTVERCPAIPLSGDSHTACSHTACSHAACSHRHCHLECSDHRCARDRLRGVEWSAIEVS